MKKKILLTLITIGIICSCVGCGNKVKDSNNNNNNNNNINSKLETNKQINKSKEQKITDNKANIEEKKEEEKENKEVDKKNEIQKKQIEKENIKNKPQNIKNFNMKNREWFFVPNKKHTTPEEPSDVLKIIKDKDAYYVGDTSKKVIYLTFDEGYENGYTEKILNTLKKNNIKACFFVTEPYIRENDDLLKRMVNEGHIVGNHSKSHVGMDKLVTRDINKFNNELLSPAKLFKEKTGAEMGKFFRPPMGAYNELSLYKTQQLGFKTIFWSMAYGDYEPNKQPTKSYAKDLILSRTHPGSIMLLHAVSKTNTEILDDLIKEWKKQGYEFKTLKDLD